MLRGTKLYSCLFCVLVLNLNALQVNSLSYRLPDTVYPLSYTLKIRPDIESNTFSGSVAIEIRVNVSIPTILLHSSQLSIKKVELDSVEANYKLHPTYEMIEVVQSNGLEISPGEHILSFEFEGSLEGSAGFFRSRFNLTEQQDNTIILVTDFQPTFARRAFPCFDEPSYKAFFNLTLVIPNYLTALSNTRFYEKFEVNSSLLVYNFKRTLKMSPYLLAFAVTNYSLVELPEKYPSFHLYSPAANVEAATVVMNYLKLSIDFFESYLNCKDQQISIDLIEFDRETAATENWGMITVKQGLLALNLGVYTDYQIGVSLAHEIAHSWFGNLVTNEWWSDIWLQEGMAVFLSMKAEEKFFSTPKYQLILSNFDDLYTLDNSENSTAIVQLVETPSQIKQHFNDITYTKSAMVLCMLENAISEQALKLALQKYVQGHRFKTATTLDFIKLVEDYHPHVRSFLVTYLYQKHYPVMLLSEDANNFILSHMIERGNWTIPITYVTDLHPNEPKSVWYDRSRDKMVIAKNNATWIKLNYQQIGYYQTIYSNSLFEKLTDATQTQQSKLSHSEAGAALNEAISLFDANLVNCDYPLNFIGHLYKHGFHQSVPIYRLTVNLLKIRLNTEELEAWTKYFDYLERVWRSANVPEKRILNFRELYEKHNVEDIVQSELNDELRDKLRKCGKWINDNL